MEIDDAGASAMTLRDCYAVLELPASASWEDVHKAHKLLATVWHPDRFTANPTLRDQAEAKLKSVNEAFATLKAHFDSGGKASNAAESAASGTAADEVYIDRHVTYHGGDERLRSVGFGKRPAMIRVGPEGITLMTLNGGEAQEAVHYAAETIRCLIAQGGTWGASNSQLPTYWEPMFFGPENVELRVSDPEMLRQGFDVKLKFRNGYYCQTFQKRVRERFCPVNVRVAYELERDRRVAEQKRRAANVAAKRSQETNGQGSGSRRGELWLIASVIIGLLLVAVSIPLKSLVAPPTSEAAIPPSAVQSGSFAAWATPVYDGYFPRPYGAPEPKPGDVPHAMQNYWITIQLEVPPGIQQFSIDDLSGEVIGSDSYRQKIPEHTFRLADDGKLLPIQNGGQMPVVGGIVQIIVKVPGARNHVSDTIVVRSKLLNEEQKLELVFGTDSARGAFAR